MEKEAFLYALLPVVAGVTALIVNRIFDRATERLAQQNRKEDKEDAERKRNEDKAEKAQAELVESQRGVIEMKNALIEDKDRTIKRQIEMIADLERKVGNYEKRPNRGVLE